MDKIIHWYYYNHTYVIKDKGISFFESDSGTKTIFTDLISMESCFGEDAAESEDFEYFEKFVYWWIDHEEKRNIPEPTIL